MKIISTILFIIVSNSLIYAQTQVIEAGIGGNSTAQMLARISTDVLAHNPETTILLGGTNDMLNSGKLATIEEFSANIISIIDQLQAINSEVILLTILPCIEEELLKRHDASAYLPDTPNGRVIKANEALEQIAIDKDVLLLDTYTLFNDNISLLSSDGVHPSATGYQTMADLIYNTVIDNNYPSSNTVACFGDSITRGYAPVFASNFAGSGEATADFEFLFEGTSGTEADLEGFTPSGGGAVAVANGALTFTYSGDLARFNYAPDNPSTNSKLLLDKANFPYLAIQLSAVPDMRQYVFIDVDGIGEGWYLDKENPATDPELIAQNVLFYDMAGENFDLDDNNNTPLVGLDDSGAGVIERLLFNYEDSSEATVDVLWIKTFASVQAIKDYVGTLSIDDVSKSLTKVISRENGIDIVEAKVNSKIEVFNLLGKKLYSSIAKSTDVSIPLLSKGLHIVKISDKASVIAKKVILK